MEKENEKEEVSKTHFLIKKIMLKYIIIGVKQLRIVHLESIELMQ
jgi:hypothetical protein